MADAPADPSAGDDAELDRRSAPGTPHWVKLAALVAVVLVLLFVAVLIFGDGRHGPGRHGGGDVPSAAQPSPAGAANGHSTPSSTPRHQQA
ncbi:MAG TPA: hypothetical protein VG474_13100 [Solirubrobacteraceae bacterium]|nr:hypothetical protein [Solirubrobacteraceae bacterium]